MRQGRREDVEHFYCSGVAEERKEMVRLMNEIMEGWQETRWYVW